MQFCFQIWLKDLRRLTTSSQCILQLYTWLEIHAILPLNLAKASKKADHLISMDFEMAFLTKNACNSAFKFGQNISKGRSLHCIAFCNWILDKNACNSTLEFGQNISEGRSPHRNAFCNCILNNFFFFFNACKYLPLNLAKTWGSSVMLPTFRLNPDAKSEVV